MKKTQKSDPKIRMEYPQGGNKSAKPSMASQKTNPSRRNRDYTPKKGG